MEGRPKIDCRVILKYLSLIQKQYNVELNEKQIFKGNLLPPDSASRIRKKRSFLKRLGNEFSEKTGMLSKGGLYYDRFMREVPNRRLRETFKKKEFKKLKVIGQFNLGFIVCTLNGSASGDLFILDQHACDERKNLEKYQKSLKIDT